MAVKFYDLFYLVIFLSFQKIFLDELLPFGSSDAI